MSFNFEIFLGFTVIRWKFSLMLNTLGKKLNRFLNIFSYFAQKTGFDTTCKLSPLETICMKCQNLFSGKNIINFLVIFWISLVKFVEKCHSSRPQQLSESKIKFMTQRWNICHYFLHKTLFLTSLEMSKMILKWSDYTIFMIVEWENAAKCSVYQTPWTIFLKKKKSFL